MSRTALRMSIAALAAACSLAIAAPAAWSYEFGDTVTGGADTVEFNGPGPCGPNHYPDGAPQAFRDALGRVQVLGAAGVNQRKIGTTLDNAVPETNPDGTPKCTALLSSSQEPDAGDYNYAEWLASVYRLDSGEVKALVHNEYHGFRTGNCPDFDPDNPTDPNDEADFLDCWEGSTTAAYSTNNGDSYEQDAPPTHLVASFPYKYESGWGAQGHGALTNIVKHTDDRFYTLTTTRSDPQTGPARYKAQKIGTCVMRTSTFEPSSWRAWGDSNLDGTNSFEVQFQNPYDSNYNPDTDAVKHVCDTVKNLQGFVPRGLTYSTYFHKYLMVGTRGSGNPPGVYYSLSEDLVNWSTTRLLMRDPLSAVCPNGTKARTVTYPSLIDPSDSTNNFERTDQQAYLYFVKSTWPADCSFPSDRDVIRVPVTFNRPIRFASGNDQCQGGGFDQHRIPTAPDTAGSFTVDATRNYLGTTTSYRAVTSAMAPFAEGVLTKDDYPTGVPNCSSDARSEIKLDQGSDAWYSAAFVFPPTGFWDQPRSPVTVLRLDNHGTGDDTAGAVSIGADARVHFVTDPTAAPGGEVELLKSPDGSNGVPIAQDNCWHTFGIHQKIGDSGAVNQIWIDGQLQQQSGTVAAQGTDNYHGAPYNRVRAGIVSTAGTQTNPLTVITDMVSVNFAVNMPYIGCRGVSEPLP